MLHCRRCEWAGLLDRDVAILHCPNCKSTHIRNSRDPFVTKKLKKNWAKPRKQLKKVKNFGLQILILEDTSRSASKGFSRCNTNTYENYKG